MAQTAKALESAVVEASPPEIQFLDLKAQFATIREEVMSAIARVMESQHFILGPEVKLLEDEVAAKLGAKHAIGCASGTDALVLSLMAAGIGAGDEVITTPFSFVATAGSIANVGARPVFVDIDPISYNLDPSRIEEAVTAKTRAIMPVHLFGLAADMAPILEVAQRHGLAVIEDAAQAIGTGWHGQAAGTLGDFGCFSFFPSKNLGGAGDGGLITTNRDEMASRLRMLRVHGAKRKYRHEILGTNSRLDALQAAILRVKLRYLDDWARARQRHAERYKEEFSELETRGWIRAPEKPNEDWVHVYNQFTIQSQFRDELKEYLKSKGIATEIYYPLCLHLQPAFEYLGYRTSAFPAAEKASQEVLSLPVYPELKDEQQDFVAASVRKFYAKKAERQSATGAPA